MTLLQAKNAKRSVIQKALKQELLQVCCRGVSNLCQQAVSFSLPLPPDIPQGLTADERSEMERLIEENSRLRKVQQHRLLGCLGQLRKHT